MNSRLSSLSAGPVLLPLIVGWALFMQTLDSTIVANALPTIAADLGRDLLDTNMMITSYLLATAIFLPASGWATDRFGTRSVFAWAIAIFSVSSLACGLSTSLPQLVVSRVIQGAAASMMTPVGRLILLRSASPQTYVAMMSYLIIPGVLGTLIGPALGGAIIAIANWRWLFLINVPMGLAGVALAFVFIPDIREGTPTRFDAAGFVLWGTAMGCLVWSLEIASRALHLAASTLVLAGVGLIALIAAIAHARATPFGLLRLSLFTVPTFRAATISGALARVAMGASPILLALMLQLGLHLSPLASGLVMIAEALGSLATIRSAQTLVTRFGYSHTLLTTGSIMAMAMLVWAMTAAGLPLWLLVFALFLSGGAKSILLSVLNAYAFIDVAPEAMSRASSLSALCQQLAISIGAVCAALSLALFRQTPTAIALTARDIGPAFAVIAIVGAISGAVAARTRAPR